PYDRDRLVMPPTVAVLLAVMVWFPVQAAFGPHLHRPLFAGLVAGYVIYDLTHYYLHHAAPRTAFGKWLRKYHLVHHFQTPDVRYGITSPLWDFVFRTYPRDRYQGVTARGPGSAAAQLPLLAFSDLLVASTFDLILDSQRAERLVYTPPEGLPGPLGAPFDPRVLRDPLVWGGIAGSLAAGLLVSRIVDGPLDTHGLGQEPIIFGARMHDAAGYPLAGALGTALFVQVAAAEEMAFRGVLQSGWARSSGETAGWAYASI